MDSAASVHRERNRRRRKFLTLLGLMPIAAVASVAAVIVATRGQTSLGSQDLEPYAGTPLGWPAPEFELTDDNGDRVRLSDFRGRVVVLVFMDARCDETCPLTAFELRLASLALEDEAGEVVFLGINVNRDFNSVEDVRLFTSTYLLREIPTWGFLTGDFDGLSRVWAAYSIEVIDQPDEDDYEHTPGIFIIDQKGDLRWYVSTPLLEGIGAEQWEGARLSEIVVARIRELQPSAARKSGD